MIAALAILLLWPIPPKGIPSPTYRGHDACMAAGREAVARQKARTWACVSLREGRS